MKRTTTIITLLAGLTLALAGCPERGDDDDDVADDDDTAQDDDDTGQDDDDSEANQPPDIISTPETVFEIASQFNGNFEPGELFVSSSRTDEVRVYDAETLALVSSFTHELFGEVASTAYTYGPNGLSFNARGNLVVAAYSAFVEFSDYGVEYARYDKVAEEATENIIFDRQGNLYTTTATGGTDQLNKYRAVDYTFETTVAVPAGAGQLTGITFDGYENDNRLYLASQTDNRIHIAETDASFTTFTWTDSLDGSGNPANLEGIQFNMTGELVAAAGDLIRYDVQSGAVIGSFDAPNDAFPVPVRVDNDGNIYTADYEDGSGSASADIFRFTPDGSSYIETNDPDLYGPFGLAISGTVLSGDPPVLYMYEVVATDPDGDDLAFTLLEGPAGMTLDAVTGMLTWWVTSQEIGQHTITIEVSDGNGETDEQTFTLEIAGG